MTGKSPVDTLDDIAVPTIDVAALKSFFEGYAFSDQPVQLTPAERITDVRRFVKLHLYVLEQEPPPVVRWPIMQRLLQLYHVLQEPVPPVNPT